METLLELPSIDSVIIAGFGTYSYFADEIPKSPFASKEQTQPFKLVKEVEEEVAKNIAESRIKYGKPILVVTRLTGDESSSVKILESTGVLPYSTPQRAAKALSRLVQRRKYLESHRGGKN